MGIDKGYAVKYYIQLKENGTEFWFRIVHRNGNIIATSEMYTRKATRTRIARNLSKAIKIPIK